MGHVAEFHVTTRMQGRFHSVLGCQPSNPLLLHCCCTGSVMQLWLYEKLLRMGSAFCLGSPLWRCCKQLARCSPSARLGKLRRTLISNHAWLHTDTLGSLNDAGDVSQCHLEPMDGPLWLGVRGWLGNRKAGFLNL